MPKLYFFDTGLACSLLGIETETQLATHPLRGSLFENAVVLDFLKRRYNAGKENNLFFWRDNTGNEIDLLLVNSDKKTPVEIKSSQTISGDFFKGIQFWNKISDSEGGYIVYGGDTMQKRSNGISAVPFHEMDKIVD